MKRDEQEQSEELDNAEELTEDADTEEIQEEEESLEDGPDVGTKALIGMIKLAVKVLCVMAVAALFVFGIRRAYRFGYDIFDEETTAEPPGKEISIRVYEDSTIGEIASTLQDYGIIDDKYVFMVQAKLYEAKPLPGTYVISTTMTVEEILNLISTEPATEEEGEGD